ncbi:MAG: hypothetical protein JXA97_11395 [Anaerolineales bacterium]|nr:hypothetical protein [Anaerolineales bacterium]
MAIRVRNSGALRVLLLTGMILAAAACGTQQAQSEIPPTSVQTPFPSSTPPPTATPFIPPDAGTTAGGAAAVPLPVMQNDLFATSGVCADCHSGMIDTAGMDVSIETDWRVSMMANAALDPFWQAAVIALHEAHPEQEARIEDSCSGCHAPMPATLAEFQDETVELLGEGGILDPYAAMDGFAADGVSCSVCHQIRADNLGFQTSYNGGYRIDTELRSPNRLIFGPYTIADELASIMQEAAGFRPEQGIHLGQSEVCATCHTVYSEYLDAFGTPAGAFPQQTTYLEWYYSDYSSYYGCVDCHMEDVDGGVRIADQSVAIRSPFEAHTFAGGNAFLLEVLSIFGGVDALASMEQYAQAAEQAGEYLQENTATITLMDPRVISGNLYADILVENAAGHKFPTGFPSRRAWLHILVLDAAGNAIFESGAVREDGSIVGNAADEEPDSYEPHYLAIVQPDQVQIYETILFSTENEITTDLLYAARYLKDNRLLPPGYEKDAPYEDLAVHGRAIEDENFDGGADLVELIAALGDAAGPYTLRVELLYQPVSFRWLANLEASQAGMVMGFLEAAAQVSNQPILIASDELQIGN